jgi:hypothetical protein
MTLRVTEEGKKKLALGTGAAGFVVPPRSVQVPSGLLGAKPPEGRTERLEKFRETHKEQELRAFIDKIRKESMDERGANTIYGNLAREADQLGFPVVAATLRGIAADEGRHSGLLESAMRALYSNLPTYK